MSTGERVAAAALALVGTPFRLHGRDPATGLDCVGLAAVALRAAGLTAVPPQGYGLRNASIKAALAFTERSAIAPAFGQIVPGDLILTTPGPSQHHLMVAGPGDVFIHAHAGLRRVVATPGPLAWPIERRWRPQTKD